MNINRFFQRGEKNCGSVTPKIGLVSYKKIFELPFPKRGDISWEMLKR